MRELSLGRQKGGRGQFSTRDFKIQRRDGKENVA